MKDSTLNKIILISIWMFMLGTIMKEAHCQTVNKSWTAQKVVFAGNSENNFQGGFLHTELPLLTNVLNRAHNSYTSDMVLQIMELDPSFNNASLVFLFDSTNDIAAGIPIDEHLATMRATITYLQSVAPNVKILIANTPPQNYQKPDGTACPDHRDAITTYNSRYSELQQFSPDHVRILDVWTPNVQTDGFAIPSHMINDCMHFGNPNQWMAPGQGSNGWPITAPVWDAAIMGWLTGK